MEELSDERSTTGVPVSGSLWVQRHELPGVIAEMKGVDCCPAELLAEVQKAI